MVFNCLKLIYKYKLFLSLQVKNINNVVKKEFALINHLLGVFLRYFSKTVSLS